MVNLSGELDMIITMSPTDYQFEYATVPKVKAPDGGMIMIAVCPSEVSPTKKVKFIMDTGCARDLVSRKTAFKAGVAIVPGDGGINFMTANGVTASSDKAVYKSKTFGRSVRAHVLESTPAVLSIGARCMQEGYSFIWPASSVPFMVNKNGDRIDLFVEDDIPYV